MKLQRNNCNNFEGDKIIYIKCHIDNSTAVNIQIIEIVTRLKWQGSTWDTEITVESFYNLKTNSFCGQTKLFAHWWRYFSSSFYVEFCVFAKICQLIILLQKYTNVISKMTWLCIMYQDLTEFKSIQIVCKDVFITKRFYVTIIKISLAWNL